MTDFDRFNPAPARAANRTPPLFAALHQAYGEGREGILTVQDNDETYSVGVAGGRVVNLTHPDAGSKAVVDLLGRAGLIGPADISAAERIARHADILLEEALVRTGRVSSGSVSNVREMLYRETLLNLILARTVEVTPTWTTRRGGRETCALPIPFLLKEAQRRSQELPGIREAIANPDQVFERSHQGDEGRWEDLKLPAAERQVFFFVDGRRSVAEVALATCQSEFEVSRAIKSLLDQGLLRRNSGTSGPRASRSGRSGILRTLALILAAAGLVLANTVGAGLHSLSRGTRTTPDLYHAVLSAGPEQRLLGAVRLYRLAFEQRPTFQDLLEERLVLPSDARAAATFRFGDGFLLTAPGSGPTPPAQPAPQEKNVQGH